MESENNKIMFLVAYLVPLITGILVYILYGSKDIKLKFQSVQAILLGICFIIAYIIFEVIDLFIFSIALSIIFDLVLLLAWLYGMYTGYKASKGMDANIPYLSDYASSISGN